jgi:hypothetical protein
METNYLLFLFLQIPSSCSPGGTRNRGTDGLDRKYTNPEKLLHELIQGLEPFFKAKFKDLRGSPRQVNKLIFLNDYGIDV